MRGSCCATALGCGAEAAHLDSRFDDAQDPEATLCARASCGGIDHVNALRCFGCCTRLRTASRGGCMASAAPDRSLREALALVSHRDGERVGQGEASRLLASWANAIKVTVKVTAAFRFHHPPSHGLRMR